MEYRVGIDLGGTNVAVGVVDENKQNHCARVYQDSPGADAG